MTPLYTGALLALLLAGCGLREPFVVFNCLTGLGLLWAEGR